MNAGTFKDKIIIQKKIVDIDNIGQQVEKWQDYFITFAYVNNLVLGVKELWEAVQQGSEKTVEFITRYCIKLSELDCVNYRIMFRNHIYDIIFIDNIQYKNNLLKMRAIVREENEQGL